jgi:hypothetical protein
MPDQRAADFGQKEASCVRYFELTFTVCGVCEASKDVLLGEKRKFAQDIGATHPAGQIVQNVVDGDAQAPDAGLSAALAGINGDDVGVLHKATLFQNLLFNKYKLGR